MKKNILTIILLSSILLTSCNNIKNNSNNVSSTKIKIETQKNKEEKKKKNKIQQKELVKKVETEIEKKKKMYDNISNFKKLPDWAKKIGIKELKELNLDNKKSYITKYNGKTPDNIEMVYSGNLKKLFIKAREISKKLNLKILIDKEDKSYFIANGTDSTGTFNIHIAINSYGNNELLINVYNLKQEKEIEENLIKNRKY